MLKTGEMDKNGKALEKSIHQKILRNLALRLKDLGFKRHRTTFFLRQRDSLVQYIHVQNLRIPEIIGFI